MTAGGGPIGLIASCGGHLAELRRLRPLYRDRPHFYVVNDRIELPDDMRGKTHFIVHSERDWRFLVNLWDAWRILRGEKPSVLISTGAGLAVPFALAAKLLSIPVIFIEISAQVTMPSLTGRILYRLADRFFYQWKPLERFFPRGIYGGLLL